MTQETKSQKIKRAQSCSDAVVASGYICAGCQLQHLCDVHYKFRRMREKEIAQLTAPTTLIYIKA